MGSRDFIRQRVHAAPGSNRADAAAGRFERYLHEITPVYARGAQGRRAPARAGEGSLRAKKTEAMYFFSESHMR